MDSQDEAMSRQEVLALSVAVLIVLLTYKVLM